MCEQVDLSANAYCSRAAGLEVGWGGEVQ